MAGRKNYKTLLLEARSLRGESGVNAHKRIGILNKVFEDTDFRSEIGAVDDYGAAEVLDDEVQDLCLRFLQLRAMYEAFPVVDDWKDGKLRTLYDRTLEIAEANKPEREPRTQNRVTQSEYQQLELEKQDTEAQLQYSKRTLEETKSEIDRLRDENLALRNDKIRLEGRIEELEKLLSPQLV